MNYLDEYDLVDEDAAGYPGSSPRGIDDHFFSSDPAEDQLEDSDLLALYDDEVNDDSELDQEDLEVLEEEEEEEQDHIEIEIDSGDEQEEEDQDQDIEIDSVDEEDDAQHQEIDSGEELEEDQDQEVDSVDEDEDDDANITWDDPGGENDSSRSSSPPESTYSIVSLDDSASAWPDDDDEDNDNTSDLDTALLPGLDQLRSSYDDFQARRDHFRSQLNSLDESRARIANAVRELRERTRNPRSFWENGLGLGPRGPSGFDLRQPIFSDRNMPGSSREGHRHHPYRMPPSAREGSRGFGDAARTSETRNQPRSGSTHNLFDELVEVEVGERPHNRRTARAANPARTEPNARTVSVIDLTEEPDSPVQATHNQRPPLPLPLPSIASFRNPRRQMSLNHRTPSLTRSDGSLLGNRAGTPPTNVIDLTMDDDTPPAQNHQGAAPNARRTNPPRQHNPPPIPPFHQHFFGILQGASASAGVGNILGMNLLQRMNTMFGGTHDVEIIGTAVLDGARVAHNPLAENLPNFNYRANGYNNGGGGGGPAKPAHEPPAPAREGYSRATGGDLAFVCPSCEEELAYDPDEEKEALSSPAKGVKRVRTKKDREEHFFWAVKECGHVYCKKCFDHRKPTRTGPKTAFRTDPANPRKFYCAVEDCKSDITAKPAWVGLFL